jgi:hypothetical protein
MASFESCSRISRSRSSICGRSTGPRRSVTHVGEHL